MPGAAVCLERGQFRCGSGKQRAAGQKERGEELRHGDCHPEAGGTKEGRHGTGEQEGKKTAAQQHDRKGPARLAEGLEAAAKDNPGTHQQAGGQIPAKALCSQGEHGGVIRGEDPHQGTGQMTAGQLEHDAENQGAEQRVPPIRPHVLPAAPAAGKSVMTLGSTASLKQILEDVDGRFEVTSRRPPTATRAVSPSEALLSGR